MQRGKKRSFFERLTGSVDTDEYDEFDDQEELYEEEVEHAPPSRQERPFRAERNELFEDEEEEGQLTVDVYQTSDYIVIKSIVAGVVPNDLDISITRDMVTIRGRRDEMREVDDENYFQKELYWGSFSRTILLPAEIEVEEAEAQEKHGLLTIRLPKIDKEKQTKLKVKFG
jgi:HSP20 family protein